MSAFIPLEILEKTSQWWSTSSDQSQTKPFADTMLVGVQHFLETSGSLIEHLLTLGLEPENVFLTGKTYSTNPDVYRRFKKVLGINVFGSGTIPYWGGLDAQISGDVGRMWEAVERRVHDSGRRRIEPRTILIIDDGAFSVRHVPPEILERYRVVAVEQTTYGTRDAVRMDGSVHVPVIDVASSAAKVVLEPPLIQMAVIERLKRAVDLDNPELRFGVVGLGNIGRAVVEYLLQRGRPLAAFDRDKYARGRSGIPASSLCESVEQVVGRSDCILGCTGDDILAGEPWISQLTGDKVLASCSSHDIEFRSLLKQVPSDGFSPYPMKEITLNFPKARLRILRGGTPVNFDGSPESVPAQDIALTRALILGALLQACDWAARPRVQSVASLKLSPRLQRFIVEEWLRTSGRKGLYDAAELKIFQSDAAVAAASGGTLDMPLGKPGKAQGKLTPA